MDRQNTNSVLTHPIHLRKFEVPIRPLPPFLTYCLAQQHPVLIRINANRVKHISGMRCTDNPDVEFRAVRYHWLRSSIYCLNKFKSTTRPNMLKRACAQIGSQLRCNTLQVSFKTGLIWMHCSANLFCVAGLWSSIPWSVIITGANRDLSKDLPLTKSPCIQGSSKRIPTKIF